MANIEVKLDTRVLDQCVAELDSNRKDVCKAFAFAVEGQIKSFADVDTGAMRNSVYTEIQGGGGTQPGDTSGRETMALPQPEGDWIATVGPTVNYAIWKEIGTAKMAATHFVERAVESVRNRFNSRENWQQILPKSARGT